MSGPKTILERLDLEEPSEIIDDAMAEIARLTSERDALKLKVERLVKALRPFSEYANCKCTCCNHDADVIAGPVTNDLNFTREITVGDLREADEAIKEAGK